MAMTYIEALEELHEARKYVAKMEDAVQALGVELVNKVLETNYSSNALNLGNFDCETSPTETCVYDVDADPNFDDCIYSVTSQPNESKCACFHLPT